MLTEQQLEDILKIFLKRAQSVNEEYLIAMGDHIREIRELIPSDINRLVQLKRMNANLDAAKKEIARIAEISADDLAKAFAAAAELDVRFVADTFDNVFRISISENVALQQILKAQFEETYGAMKNLSQTTIESEGYRKAVDKGIQAVQSGMEDYSKAIRRALSEAASDGLRVTYPSGRTMRLDSAVRQNVLDGIRALNNNVLEQAGREFGADGIEISAHALCAEDHLPYQGRQYSNAEFAKLQDKLPRPFGMWNCKHSMHPILLGISEPAYTDEELADYRSNSSEKITIEGKTLTRYQWTQQQRKIETAVRYEKDKAVAAKAAGDNVLRRECQRNINALQEQYEKISNAAGIKTEFGRMRVEGFKFVSAKELKKQDGIEKAGRVEANGLFVNKSEILFKNAKQVKPVDGYEDFTCHADAYNFFIDMKGNGRDEDNFKLTPAEYAEAIRNSPKYKGGNVRILSCQAGAKKDGAAQKLADALGVNVLAPTEVVNIADNGEVFLSDNDILADLWYNASDREKIKETGKWVVFKPGKE